jgi:hypothetical protein
MVATISKTTSDMDGMPELQQRYSRADFPTHGMIASDVPFNAVTGVVPDPVISSLLDLLGGASEESGVA